MKMPCRLCRDQWDTKELMVQKTIQRNQFWDSVSQLSFNERQRKMLELLLDDFKGNITSGKWAKICHCSTDTALNYIKDLLQKGILDKAGEGEEVLTINW